MVFRTYSLPYYLPSVLLHCSPVLIIGIITAGLSQLVLGLLMLRDAADRPSGTGRTDILFALKVVLGKAHSQAVVPEKAAVRPPARSSGVLSAEQYREKMEKEV